MPGRAGAALPFLLDESDLGVEGLALGGDRPLALVEGFELLGGDGRTVGVAGSADEVDAIVKPPASGREGTLLLFERQQPAEEIRVGGLVRFRFHSSSIPLPPWLYAHPVRFYLVIQTTEGTKLPLERVELDRLPTVGTALRPPVSERPCFITRAVPASIEATGDVRVAGTIYADLLEAG